MPVSTVDIVNTALDYIGQGLLTSLEEDSPLAEKARRLWPLALDEVLRAHFWKCASNRAKLNELGEKPSFGFARAFGLPGDFIRLEETEPRNARVKVEGRSLLTDEKEISIVYVRRLEDSTLYDATFRQCLALKLASMMAFGSAASTALSQDMDARYKEKLREARMYDTMEGTGLEVDGRSSWANAKLGG